MRVAEPEEGGEEGSSLIDVEGFGYNENGAVIFDGGSYSTGPEYIGGHRAGSPAAPSWLSCSAGSSGGGQLICLPPPPRPPPPSPAPRCPGS
jgi:hypothetical protein